MEMHGSHLVLYYTNLCMCIECIHWNPRDVRWCNYSGTCVCYGHFGTNQKCPNHQSILLVIVHTYTTILQDHSFVDYTGIRINRFHCNIEAWCIIKILCLCNFRGLGVWYKKNIHRWEVQIQENFSQKKNIWSLRLSTAAHVLSLRS